MIHHCASQSLVRVRKPSWCTWQCLFSIRQAPKHRAMVETGHQLCQHPELPQNCRWTKCLPRRASILPYKAFIPPKRTEVPKLGHFHFVWDFVQLPFDLCCLFSADSRFHSQYPVVTLFVTHSMHRHLQVFSFLSKKHIGDWGCIGRLRRKGLHERLTSELEARARFLKKCSAFNGPSSVSSHHLRTRGGQSLWRRFQGETMSLDCGH